MTYIQVDHARIVLQKFVDSGWFAKVAGLKVQRAITVALWALDQVARAMDREAT